jgi:GH24 family phage-related lysozyme (muramidase)
MTQTWDRKTVVALVAIMVARIEKFVAHAYWDPIGKCWTYGFGFTYRPGGSVRVRQGDAITLPQAQQYLTILLAKHTATICAAVTAPISETTAAALYDFLHEEGDGALGGSMVAKALDEGDLTSFEAHLMGWVVGGGKPELGIARRRRYEALQAVHGMAEGAAYTQAWQMTDAEMMAAYAKAFSVAHAAGWQAPSAATQTHAGMSTSAAPIAHPAPVPVVAHQTTDRASQADLSLTDEQQTDALNDAQLTSIKGATT